MTEVVSHCHLRNGAVSKDGSLLFEHAGTHDEFVNALYTSLKVEYPKFYKMDRLSKVGFLASEVLLRDQSTDAAKESVSLVLSNGSSSLDTDLQYLESLKTIPSPSLFVYTLPNIVAGEICIRNGFKGESTFFISPSFDAEATTSYADLVLAKEENVFCIAGWVELLRDQADVFLYLARKTNQNPVVPHTSSVILDLYHSWKR